MNRATKERIARNKRWRAMMQAPRFRACYKRLAEERLRAMSVPRVVVPLTFDATLAQYTAHIHYTPIVPIEDATASLERENARLTRLQWLVWPA